MHVLSEPIRRDLAAEAFRFGRVVDFLADRGKLRAQADVVDKARDLFVVLAPFDSPAE